MQILRWGLRIIYNLQKGMFIVSANNSQFENKKNKNNMPGQQNIEYKQSRRNSCLNLFSA
ncbi:hypothetical protein EZS27_038803, partial [termite gut metagenome]